MQVFTRRWVWVGLFSVSCCSLLVCVVLILRKYCIITCVGSVLINQIVTLNKSFRHILSYPSPTLLDSYSKNATMHIIQTRDTCCSLQAAFWKYISFFFIVEHTHASLSLKRFKLSTSRRECERDSATPKGVG